MAEIIDVLGADSPDFNAKAAAASSDADAGAQPPPVCKMSPCQCVLFLRRALRDVVCDAAQADDDALLLDARIVKRSPLASIPAGRADADTGDWDGENDGAKTLSVIAPDSPRTHEISLESLYQAIRQLLAPSR